MEIKIISTTPEEAAFELKYLLDRQVGSIGKKYLAELLLAHEHGFRVVEKKGVVVIDYMTAYFDTWIALCNFPAKALAIAGVGNRFWNVCGCGGNEDCNGLILHVLRSKMEKFTKKK
jgi:hypothetical protein